MPATLTMFGTLPLSLRKSEMVRKSGVLFAANTRKAMSSWSRWAIRREDATPMQ